MQDCIQLCTRCLNNKFHEYSNSISLQIPNSLNYVGLSRRGHAGSGEGLSITITFRLNACSYH